ncbi:MAG: transposase [Flammeovirgaceae bacterium]|jgi:REP element-mobilizing transposase RayT|nr:transposase [Flammeovirgaceae bacterium]
MSEKYKIFDQDKIYFVTFAVVYWVDVFTRREYRDLLIEILAYYHKEKGLDIYTLGIMSDHIHLIVG